MRSPGPDRGELIDLADEPLAEDAGLELEESAITHAVAEARVRGELVGPALVGADEGATAAVGEGDAGAREHEVAAVDAPGCEQAQDSGVDPGGAEGLDEVEGERGSPGMDHVQEAEHRIEADARGGGGGVADQEGVAEAEQSV